MFSILYLLCAKRHGLHRGIWWSGAPIKLLSLEFYAGCSLLVLSSLSVVCLAHLYFQNVVVLGDFLFSGLPGVSLLVKVTCLTAATQTGHAAM